MSDLAILEAHHYVSQKQHRKSIDVRLTYTEVIVSTSPYQIADGVCLKADVYRFKIYHMIA